MSTENSTDFQLISKVAENGGIARRGKASRKVHLKRVIIGHICMPV